MRLKGVEEGSDSAMRYQAPDASGSFQQQALPEASECTDTVVSQHGLCASRQCWLPVGRGSPTLSLCQG